MLIKNTITLVLLAAIAGCAPTMSRIAGSPIVPAVKNCNPTIFETIRQAEKKGPIEELCVVKDDSGFSVSIDGIKEASKEYICQCGATDAYIQSSSGDGFWVAATATVVGFRYVTESIPSTVSAASGDLYAKCKAKGGSLISGVCQISLD